LTRGEQHENEYDELGFQERSQDHRDRDDTPPMSAQCHQEHQTDRRKEPYRVTPIDGRPRWNGRRPTGHEDHHPFEPASASRRPRGGRQDRDRHGKQIGDQA
jgi:hypothetical protein